jgi:hypothetical protein
LDLYFLARSFKKPEGSEKPLVSFGYFGVDHSLNIRHFLLNIMGNYTDNYTEDNSTEDNSTKEPNRCLKITKNINLDKMMEHYKSLQLKQYYI